MIHPLANVMSGHIGENTKIWQYAVILEGAEIGTNCNINCHTFIENNVRVGNNVTIKSGVYLWDGITVANNVFIGPNVTFTNDLYPRSKRIAEKFTPLLLQIEEGASIGANATINGGITIGAYCMIGAASVLTKSTAPFTLWYGAPATQRGYVTREGVALGMNLEDKEGRKYSLEPSGEPLLLHSQH